MLVADVLLALAALGDRAAAWDPYGLQLGDSTREAETVGVCHEVSDEVVEKVTSDEEGVDLLITYHPLLFKPVNRLTAGRGPASRAYRLIRSDISLAVVHTAWDSASGGTADALAAFVGIQDAEPFGGAEGPAQLKLVTFLPSSHVDQVAQALTAAGAGRIGNYSGCSFRSEGIGTFLPLPGSSPTIGESGRLNEVPEVRLEMLVPAGSRIRVVAALLAIHPYEEPAFDLYETNSNSRMIGRIGAARGQLSALIDLLRTEVGPEVRAGGSDRPLGHVAVLPGSGGSFVAEAHQCGADVLITGDVSHHQMREALDLGMAVIDVGHAPSERPGVAALIEAAKKIGPNMVDVDVDPTPWSRR